jgi:acetyl-CoA acyltransferase
MNEKRRVGIVAGLRTPFVKSGTLFRELSALELGAACVTELVARSSLRFEDVDQVVFGAVVADVRSPNIARDVALLAGFPARVDAYSVSRACATSTQAIVEGARAIREGSAAIVVAGGTDSLSRPPITYDDAVVDALLDARAAKDLRRRVGAFTGLRPRHLAPRPPALADLSSGLTMGQAAEKMARENGIARTDQDRYALESHRKAVDAWGKGVYDDEVMALGVPPDYEPLVERDTIPRPDSSLEKLSSLPPVFDREHGSVTAGNSSPLTDGAAAVVMMSEEAAAEHGIEPKAFVRAWGFAGVDPAWQMLMGPAFAIPVALDAAGLTMADVDVVDMHEAFAAQTLSNLAALASDEWAREHIGRPAAVGPVEVDRLNPYGGSIALGHPFAATGARQAITMANELARRDNGVALVTQCAAGGLGAALVLER